MPDSPQKPAEVDGETKRLLQIDVANKLAKVKRIPTQREATYLADIVARIEAGDPQAHWNSGESFLHGKLFLADPFQKIEEAPCFGFVDQPSWDRHHLSIISE